MHWNLGNGLLNLISYEAVDCKNVPALIWKVLTRYFQYAWIQLTLKVDEMEKDTEKKNNI